MTDQKVELYYNGPDGDVNYDVAKDTGGSAILKTGKHYTLSRDVAARVLQTAGWQEKGGSGKLTEEAQHVSPKYSTDPGGEASYTNPGSQEYWDRKRAEEEGEEEAAPAGPSSEERPNPTSTPGEPTGGGEADKQKEKKEGGS